MLNEDGIKTRFISDNFYFYIENSMKLIKTKKLKKEEFIKEAVLNGAKYFIVKPLEEEFVVNTINRILTC